MSDFFKQFRFFFVSGLLLASVTSYAQKTKTRQELERKKKENLEKIEEINNILQKTTQNKEVNLGQLKAINRKVKAKEQQIELINEDLQVIDDEIEELNKLLAEMGQEQEKLEKEYARMIYNSSKIKNNFSAVSFLFSSKTLNELFVRYNYLRMIGKAREKQAQAIKLILKDLSEKQLNLAQKRNQKNKVLGLRQTENNELVIAKTNQQEVTNKLIKKESQLQIQLASRKRAVAQLEGLISRAIEREIVRSNKKKEEKEEAKSEKAEENITGNKNTIKKKEGVETGSKNTIRMNATETSLAGSFSANKARLPWPVKSGFISEGFGSHPHEVLKGVTVPNDGIEIQTQAGEAVRAVFDGTVMVVDNSIVGMGTVVAVQHGHYFTIYGKLRGVTVSVGQKVEARETIGQVMEGADGTSELQFQIWKNTDRQNPERWLIRK